MLKSKLNIFLKVLVGISILFLLVYKVGINEIYENISKINPVYIPLIFFVIFLTNLVSTYKIMFFFRPLKIRMSLKKVCHYYFLSTCFGKFIPGKFGELFLIYFLKKEGVSIGVGSAIVVLDKIIGLLINLVITIGGVFMFFTVFDSIKIISFLTASVFVILFFLFSEFGRSIIKRIMLKRWESKFVGFSNTLFLLIKQNRILVIKNIFMSMAKWTINALSLFILFYALNQNVSLLMIVIINSMMVMIKFLPISINGLGIKESFGVFSFGYIGVPLGVTSGVLFALLIINYILSALYLMFFWNLRVDVRKILANNKNGSLLANSAL